MAGETESHLIRAKIAEQAERYEDMAEVRIRFSYIFRCSLFDRFSLLLLSFCLSLSHTHTHTHAAVHA